MRTLKQLIKFFKAEKNIADLYFPQDKDPVFEYLESDSRKVGSKDIFVALCGLHQDGRNFIKKAQEQGASAYIYREEPSAEQLDGVSIPGFKLPEKCSLAHLASWFYEAPSKRLKLVGITGTNGKSTVTWMISQLLNSLGCRCAVIGTLGTGFLPHLEKSSNTTPDALALQRTLYDLVKHGARYAAMEVSSIGIDQGRVDECEFAAVAFTNLTRDHLDYHKNMENYYHAKKRLFSGNEPMAINADDEYGCRLINEIQSRDVLTYSVEKNGNFRGGLSVEKVRFCRDGIDLKVKTPTDSGECHLPLLGSFNVQNFACAMSVALQLKMDFNALLKAVSALRPVTGRMECFRSEGHPALVVDYAHTPDGVEQVLRAAREHHPQGRIFVVLGCGGDRDRGKRPIMAIKASVFADEAVFTSDNPRSEDPEEILHDMQLGVTQASNCVFITDREKAIRYAFDKAGKDDCVVIAGKGHEDYQIFKDKTVHFSDREIAAKLCGVNLD